MFELPQHLLKPLMQGKTSLGDHPAFPPDEEDKYIVNLIRNAYDEISSDFNTNNVIDIQNEFTKILTTCIRMEQKNKQALEKLCFDTLVNMFEIPEDSIIIESNLVTKVSQSKLRNVPDKTNDYTFDSIDDMNTLTDEIYKRRMINALIYGASISEGWAIGNYVQDLYRIDPNLPSMYNKLYKLMTYLNYLTRETDYIKGSHAGNVDVYIEQYPEKPRIIAEGVIFPILLQESIKGILELSVAHGLPKDFKKAHYITMKADFKMAELWDIRLGLPLWTRVVKLLLDNNIDMQKIGLNYFMLKLSQMDPSNFNIYLQNAFVGSKQGRIETMNICNNIMFDKQTINNYRKIQTNNKTHQINDSEYTDEEILDEINSM